MSQLLVKLNYDYHFYILLEKEVNSYSKFLVAELMALELNNLPAKPLIYLRSLETIIQ